MAIGNLEDIVSAFRGNPMALQERYAQNQELIDLLALQKLKSEKEAAARDMQMKMAQQQAMSGMPPTIKDQREQEVLNMTKQELAQQNTATRQQQQQEQQKAMQQLLSGIAQNSAPNMQFAGGGIVAFADGGPTSSPIGRRLSPILSPGGLPGMEQTEALAREVERLRRRKRELGGLLGFRQQTPEQAAEYDRVNDQLMELEAQLAQRRSGRMEGAAPAPQRPQVDMATMADMVSELPSATQPPVSPQGQPTPLAAPVAPRVPAPAARAATTPAVPAAPPQSTSAGIMAALPQQTQNLNVQAQEVASRLMGQDPAKMQLEEEQRQEARRQLAPEQRAVYEGGIAERQRMLEALRDPEQMRNEALRRGLMAAAGGGNFAAVGTGIMNAREQQRLQQERAFEEMQKRREGLVGIDREVVEKAITGGEKRRGEVSQEVRGGLEQSTKLVDLMATLENAGLDRTSRERIAMAQVEAQREANRLQREYNGEIKSDREYRQTLDSMNRQINQIVRPIDAEIKSLTDMQSFGVKLDKDQQARLSALRAGRDEAVKLIEDQYRPMLDKYNPAGGGQGGFKVLGVKER